MIGDPIPADKLFLNSNGNLSPFCYVRVTALTNAGVATYIHGSLLGETRRPNDVRRGPPVISGRCVAVFSDRKYEIPNGVQNFSALQVDVIYISIRGPSPLAGTGYSVTLRFGSPDGPKLDFPVALQGSFLIGTTPLKRNSQTTYSFGFVEGDLNIPG